uniref:Bifunctional inhibitor/plant lipid transfer protein/seed storage helical domain-containing protein n=1 Tax=Kalanchoe fedtschenkoi TaxID=63787 RepID=A0A7N0U8E9_KALFE
MKPSTFAVAIMVFMLFLTRHAQVSTAAVTCSPVELSSCVSAITSSTPPTRLCCAKIKEQRPCLCQYLKNPTLKKFVNTPNARRVARTCGTPYPRC